MSGLFVTATGTDIGKTYVSAGLLRAWRRAGLAPEAFKPVLSGFDGGGDAAELLAALGRAADPAGIAAMSPWRFAAPLSPDMAAAREGRRVDPDELLAFCRKGLAGRGPVLIEGVGGAMVPIDGVFTVRDWIAALEIPAILVGGTYLGAISHALTAAEALAARGIPLAALVLSESEISPVPPAQTAAALGRFLPRTPIVTIGRPGSEDAFDRLAAAVRGVFFKKEAPPPPNLDLPGPAFYTGL